MTITESKTSAAAQLLSSTFTEVLQRLRAPVDPQYIKQREGWTDYSGEKQMVNYVEWHTVADILDRQAPTWTHSIQELTQMGETMVVVAAITIHGVTREGIGTGNVNTETGIKKAEHDALKRAAIKFGIARDLYHRERSPQPDGQPTRTRPTQPKAQSVSDLATPKQLALINRLCRGQGIQAADELREGMQLDCELEELSRRAASMFIEHLQGLAAR